MSEYRPSAWPTKTCSSRGTAIGRVLMDPDQRDRMQQMLEAAPEIRPPRSLLEKLDR